MALSPFFGKAVVAASVSVALTACSVTPNRLTDQQVMSNALDNSELLALDFAPIIESIDLNDAFARIIKHNRDARLKAFEAVVSQGQLAVDQFDMLPELAVKAGYSERSEYDASASVSYSDGNAAALGDNPSYSVSDSKTNLNGSIGATWDTLDFGLSYYRNKQQADRFLIAKERERKVVHTIMQQARNAYYRAVSAERLLNKIDPLIVKVRSALSDSSRIEKMRIQSPMEALTYQRSLLEALRTLQELRKDLMPAKAELATLMGLNPAQSYELADVSRSSFKEPVMKLAVEDMERTALVQRPELIEAQYQERITKEEVDSAFLTLFPSLSLNAGVYYNNSDYLKYNDWTSAGAGVNWNLMNVFRYGKIKQLNSLKLAATKQQALATSMAVISQVHIANIQFLESKETYGLSIDYLDVADRIYQQIISSKESNNIGELTVIREELNTLLAELRRDVAYAELQNNFGKILVSIGLDPLPSGFGRMDLAQLSDAFEAMFSHWEQGDIKLISKEEILSASNAEKLSVKEG